MVKKKKYLLIGSAIILVGIAVILKVIIKPSNEKYQKIRKGDLEIVVKCKGEVKGENFIEIKLPDELCDEDLHLYQFKIADAVVEGKAVKKGSYIAKLDDSQILTNMRNLVQDKEKIDADLRNVVLDSAVILSQRREAINNAKLDLEYLKIDLEQSKYESEAYQRKTQMNYQKAEIEVDRIRRNYLLDKNRSKLQITRFKRYVDTYTTRIQKFQNALEKTIITAPESGIVVFTKDRMGKPFGKDSQIEIWHPLIASLPDMSVVITETFVREIDISKVNLGDTVRISIEALPEKKFLGKVIKIANIGEDHKDFDMKVFRVLIRFERSDKDMKPGMNANSDIVIDSYHDKLLVPRKAVFSKAGKQIVYLKKGGNITAHEVKLVAENDDFGVVENDIKEGDVVLLYQPDEFKVEAGKVVSKE